MPTGNGVLLHRDSVDARLIAELTSLGKLGKISHNETEAGGIGEPKSGKPAFDSTKFKTAAELETFLNKLAGD
ncbi:MAG: hypothetical protein EXS35_01575 [Pedosphaera sp.]|nr:hypothetical protein [Pedosphaera sp.]